MKEYILNIATVLFIICYFPDFYAIIKNKNAKINNIPEKLIILLGSSCGLHYAVINNNSALLFNYTTILTLDIISLLLRLYYAYKNYLINKNLVINNYNNNINNNNDINNPIHDIIEIHENDEIDEIGEINKL